MRLAAVTGCNLPYVPGATILLRDLKRFHPDIRRFCIAPANEADAVQKALGDLAEVYPQRKVFQFDPDGRQFNLFKVFTPCVDADVACWFDCDMVICRPMPEAWQVEPGQVVAVMDTAFKLIQMVEPELRPQFERQFPGVGEGRGCNTGVFALRCGEWQDLPERYESAFLAGGYRFHPTMFDQPFLNGLWLPNIRYLPHAFNSHHVFDYAIPSDARVVHFTNNPKPWQPSYPKHEPAYYWWLRHGLKEERFSKLATAKLKIWLRTPQRLLSRWLRNRGWR